MLMMIMLYSNDTCNGRSDKEKANSNDYGNGSDVNNIDSIVFTTLSPQPLTNPQSFKSSENYISHSLSKYKLLPIRVIFSLYGFDQQRLIWYVCRLWDMVFS